LLNVRVTSRTPTPEERLCSKFKTNFSIICEIALKNYSSKLVMEGFCWRDIAIHVLFMIA